MGAEFKLSSHPCSIFGDDANDYMAAAGHFGNKSPELVKHFVQDLGFTYLSATNKEEYLAAVKEFTCPEIGEKPIVFEIFTNHKDENKSLSLMCNIEKDDTITAKKLVKGILGDKGVDAVKKVLGR